MERSATPRTVGRATSIDDAVTDAPRLAVVTNDYPPKPGGIQQYLGNLVDAYPGDVCVLAPRDGPASATARGEAVVRRSPWRFMWPTPRVARWVDRELESFRPDAVLFGAPHPLPLLAGRIRRRRNVTVGVLCHGAEVTIPAAVPLLRTALARLLRGADVRFAVSRFTVQRVASLTGEAAVYVGAGVDIDRFTPALAERAGPLRIVGCVSRFVPRKGQARLIDAAAALLETGTPCELLFVGKGRNEARLRTRAAERGVSARLEVDVPWETLPQLYAEMDVFCMPCRSRWGGLEVEGLGLVFLEAAAAGLPVLAGDSGGAPETVVPGETGFVVHDVSDIVQGLEMLLGDAAQARSFGLAGRKRVEEEFTWNAVAERVVEGLRAAAATARS